MKVEVAVLGSPSLIVFMVSVDVKQHMKKEAIVTGKGSISAMLCKAPVLTRRTGGKNQPDHISRAAPPPCGTVLAETKVFSA